MGARFDVDLLPAGVMVAMGVAVLPIVTMVTTVDVFTGATLKRNEYFMPLTIMRS